MQNQIVWALAAMVAIAGCSRDSGPPASTAAPAESPTAGRPSAPPPDGELKVGDPAPDFSLVGSDGKKHALSDHRGKEAVVIAWFPKAFTGG